MISSGIGWGRAVFMRLDAEDPEWTLPDVVEFVKRVGEIRNEEAERQRAEQWCPTSRVDGDPPGPTLPAMADNNSTSEGEIDLGANTLRDVAKAAAHRCTGFRCEAAGTIDSGDFGWVCPGHYAQIANTVGT